MRKTQAYRQAIFPAALSTLALLTVAGCVRSSNSSDAGSTSHADSADASGAVGSDVAPAHDGTTGGRVSDAARSYPLDSLPTSTVTVNEHVFRVWLAQEFVPRAPQADRTVIEEGLMYVPPEEIADDQGMLFVFSDERVRGFWMHNTITPLDIAFVRTSGTIVKIWQMPPLTLRSFSSIEPAMFALELKQGTFDRLGIEEGERLRVSPEVFEVSE